MYHRPKISTALAAILSLCLLALTSCGKTETFEPPAGEGPWVLVDLYHTTIQNPVDYRLDKGVYNYQGVFGYARAFDHLEENGYKWRALRNSPLSKQRLEGFDVLFINLVHDERPDFTDEEVEVIKEYVENGGGLFVVADHTNVYYHAERVNRFLEPMGIEVTYHTAIETGSQSVAGLGWIAIDDLTDHPVNEGVEMFSFQTGGTMRASGDNATVTARLSENGFADFWDESTGAGFYGNWTFDGDETLEPKGKIPAGMVAEYGQGRIVVVGDQNMFGDAWLHFADNFEYMMNSFEWLAKQDEVAKPRLADIKPKGLNIGVDARLNGYATGNGGSNNYYNFFVHLNRDQEVTGSGILEFANEEDVVVLPSPSGNLEQEDLDGLLSYLESGKRVVLMFEATELGETRMRPTVKLLKEFAPGFNLIIGGQEVAFADDPSKIQAKLRPLQFPTMEGDARLVSDRIDVDGIELAAAREVGSGDDLTREPYLLDITTEWGEPLLQTEGGIDIARSMRIGEGELVVVLQDGFWRNRTIGKSESAPPYEIGEPAVDLLYNFVNYLKTPLERCQENCAELPEPTIIDKPTGPGPWVLVDLYHTRKQNPEDYRLTKGLYRYQGTHGYARAFDHLEQNGYQWRSVREEPLTDRLLEGYDIIFINLVHDERPDFTSEEVELIKEFVEDGGGLLVVGDHTNVYYHAERVNRFLEPMGIEVTYHTAVDYGDASVTGLGWIAMDATKVDHPVNEDVGIISFQTGGTMRKTNDNGTVTLTLSERGLADLWDESSGLGFYGNWSFDGDETLEPRGASPTGMVGEYGEGRVVVVGDQNMFGDVWLHFAGNFEHWSNSMEWLAQKEGEGTPLRSIKPTGFNIAFPVHYSNWAPGNTAPDNYFVFFVNFNRDQQVTNRGVVELRNTEDALIMTPVKTELEQEDLDKVKAYLDAGKKVTLLLEADSIANNSTQETLKLIQYLAPELEITTGDTTISFNQPIDRLVAALRGAEFGKVDGLQDLTSEYMSVAGSQIASYDGSGDSGGNPYLLDITSSWGEPLLQTTDGIDIARKKRVGDGELIIFIQDGFWRVRTTGKTEISPPPEPGGKLAETLQFRFLDYLKKDIED